MQVRAQYQHRWPGWPGRKVRPELSLDSGSRYEIVRHHWFFFSATLREADGRPVANYEYNLFRRRAIAIPGQPDLNWYLDSARGACFAYRFSQDGQNEFHVPIRGPIGLNPDLKWTWDSATFGAGLAEFSYKFGKGYRFQAQVEGEELPAVALSGFFFWDLIRRFEG